MLPMISSAAFRCASVTSDVFSCSQRCCCESFLAGNGIEEKLASLFVLKISRRVADVLGHVIAPLLVQLSQTLELFLEFTVVLRSFLRFERVDLFLQDRIGLQFLLNDVSEFQGVGLQDLQTLLQLRRKHLLH